MDRVLHWIGDVLTRGARTVAHTPGLRWWLLAALVAIVAAIVTHTLTSRVGDGIAAERRTRRHRGGAAGDPWALAQRLASSGRYTEAAHALYQGLLQAIARRDNIQLHESKTVGDYTRDLRAHASQRFAPFREFARTYEVVVYGLGTCDHDRYDRLQQLALAIADTHG